MLFIEAFENSDLAAMEQALQNKSSNTDLSVLLYTVLYGFNSVYRVREHFPPRYSTPLNTDKSMAYAVFELLIKYGVNLNVVPSAYYHRNTDNKIKLVWEPGHFGPLTTAIYQGFTIQVLRLLLDSKANPNLQLGSFYDTPLIAAVSMENIAAVYLLLEYGANVNAPGFSVYNYPIETAARRNLEITKILVEAGANVNQWDSNNGDFPAQAAYESGNIDVYLYLKDKGAAWTAPDHSTLSA